MSYWHLRYSIEDAWTLYDSEHEENKKFFSLQSASNNLGSPHSAQIIILYTLASLFGHRN